MPQLAAKGVVSSSPKQPFPSRLAHLFREISEIVHQAKPNVIAIENAIYAQNAQTALKLGHARGALLLAGALKEIEIAEYTPKEVKRAVTGNGNASKEQVQRMVQSVLALSEPPTPDDVADAIAVAICHFHRA